MIDALVMQIGLVAKEAFVRRAGDFSEDRAPWNLELRDFKCLHMFACYRQIELSTHSRSTLPYLTSSALRRPHYLRHSHHA